MRNRWLVIVLVLAIVAAVGVASVPEMAWRLEVVGKKMTGQIHDLSWSELLKMLKPGSGYFVRNLVDDPNPFSVIHDPLTSADDRRQGEAIFKERCAACHGLDGHGGHAPDIVTRPLRNGDSDWALFRTTQRGIPGTAMAPVALSDDDRWRVVAHLAAMRQEAEAHASPVIGSIAINTNVSSEDIEASRSHPENWLTYSGAYDGWRYSGLDEIKASNVGALTLAWSHQFDAREMIEASPLVVDGVMYLTEPASNVFALDAATGQTLWTYRRSIPDDVAACCGHVNRGVAVLGDRVYVGTLDAHLVALDAKTGKVVWDVEVAPYKSNFTMTGAPLVARGKIIVGVGGGDFGIRGVIDAYDAKTGARLWRFTTVPAPGEDGSDSWSGDSWKIGGGATWLTGSFDPLRGHIYWGIGNPAPDFNGTARLGDNLFTNSVVALDVETGKRVWHFQFTPHDEHDWDSNQIPVLVDRDIGGTHRALMLWANRNGFYYVLDRDTGRMVTARPFAKQNWATEIDPSGRPKLSEFGTPSETGTLTWPGASGATNWWAPSYSPSADLFFVPTLDRPGVFFRRAVDDKPEQGVELLGSGVAYADAKHTSVIALSPLTGERVWEYSMPARLSAQQRQQIGGILSTAGGVLFVGDAETFYALDAAKGTKLWSVNVGGHINASPVTYAVQGRQLVVIPAGNSLFAFGPAPKT